jgi:hypothetical protein
MPSPVELIAEISSKIGNAANVAALRAGRRISTNGPVRPGFFDQYPRFFDSSETTAFANRLNERHRAIIESNHQAIAGKRVVDIASHDGRWSFAALKAGASHVTGLEARDHLVKASRENLQHAGIAGETCSFVLDDAFRALQQIEPGSVDTVMCLGFFYHVTDHMPLLFLIDRLRPRHLIMDTAVVADPRPVVVWQAENHGFESDAVKTSEAQKTVLAGIPSRSALDLMLSSFGWKPRYYDWRNAGIRNWTHIEDYQEGTRVTLRVDI